MGEHMLTEAQRLRAGAWELHKPFQAEALNLRPEARIGVNMVKGIEVRI